jgi:hypothetical protein
MSQRLKRGTNGVEKSVCRSQVALGKKNANLDDVALCLGAPDDSGIHPAFRAACL